MITVLKTLPYHEGLTESSKLFKSKLKGDLITVYKCFQREGEMMAFHLDKGTAEDEAKHSYQK